MFPIVRLKSCYLLQHILTCAYTLRIFNFTTYMLHISIQITGAEDTPEQPASFTSATNLAQNPGKQNHPMFVSQTIVL